MDKGFWCALYLHGHTARLPVRRFHRWAGGRLIRRMHNTVHGVHARLAHPVGAGVPRHGPQMALRTCACTGKQDMT